ncbi:hypothetical protein ACR777_20125 [Sphingobacterium spiritivorum]|uniref:hypothetical protein n=1 Tax=Sphingobacterium spiritivorum TaxID=258 RepID=UPI003DA5FF68
MKYLLIIAFILFVSCSKKDDSKSIEFIVNSNGIINSIRFYSNEDKNYYYDTNPVFKVSNTDGVINYEYKGILNASKGNLHFELFGGKDLTKASVKVENVIKETTMDKDLNPERPLIGMFVIL